MKFKGIDWTELSKAFKINTKQKDDVVFDKTLDYLENSYSYNNKKLEKKTAKLIREFLAALIKGENTYNTPVWEGLLKVKHDETLIKFTVELLYLMWS